MNPMIYRLCDRPEWADVCRQWDEEAWPRTSPEMVEFFAEHYTQAADRKNKDAPQTWIAVVKDHPVGMISLIKDDHPDYLHLHPWLASAFVLPDMRGKGIFRKLHDALIEFVKNEMKLPEVYVYSHIDFKTLGWSTVEETDDPFAPDHKVTIFKQVLNPTASK